MATATAKQVAPAPLLTVAELKPLLGQPGVRVLDIRADKDYAGGHIPGAVNTPYGKYRGPKENPGQLPAEAAVTQVLQALTLLPADQNIIGTPFAVIFGLTYNFIPFMILPIYVSLEKIDRRLLEAAQDLYASSWGAFRRITLPLAIPGIFAGSLLTFIPAIGDFINAELLGNPGTAMIGNVIQKQFLVIKDYPVAAAMSFVLMAIILVGVLLYTRALGTEELV